MMLCTGRRHTIATFHGYTLAALHDSHSGSEGYLLGQFSRDAGLHQSSRRTYALRTLKRLGLVVRRIDNQDERVVRVFPSAKGRSLWEQMTPRLPRRKVGTLMPRKVLAKAPAKRTRQ